MTKKQFILLFVTVLILGLIFTNPSENEHIDTVKSKLKTAFKKKMSADLLENKDNEDSFAMLGNGLGLMLGDTFIDNLTDGFISRENYILFSLTKATYQKQEKIIGFGVLGNVFLSEKIDKIYEDVEENEQAYQ
tara:strand:+ start:1395 stop:1796 length:402 start_codon:yes stop_codon:yes gene_type:complete